MTQTRKNRNNIHNKTKRVFSKKDYNSGDGMITYAWGPALWHYIHMMSFNYPVNPTMEDKKNYRSFIKNLQYVLPCKYCRINLRNNFKKKPIEMCHMKNRETFSRYVYELHELVNKMLHKKSHLTYCEVRERYEHFRSRCTEENPKVFTFKKLTKKRRSGEKEKEKGCTEPLYGKKSKCVINIIPKDNRTKTFNIDPKCVITKGNKKKEN
jgi:hypothetical protein